MTVGCDIAAAAASVSVDDVAALCLACGIDTTPAQVAALLAYLHLLQRWNRTYNLTSVREPAAMLSHHLADCLAVVPPLRRHAETLRCRAGPLRVLDVGSGGGLPAVVIAVLMPQWWVTSVDAVGKKAAFVRQVASELPLANLVGTHARIEQLRETPFDVVTCRAFASLSDFAGLTRGLLAPDGIWMAMKGKAPDDEIAALPDDVGVFHVEQLTVPTLDAERCLVWMRPRQPSAIPSGCPPG